MSKLTTILSRTRLGKGIRAVTCTYGPALRPSAGLLLEVEPGRFDVLHRFACVELPQRRLDGDLQRARSDVTERHGLDPFAVAISQKCNSKLQSEF